MSGNMLDILCMFVIAMLRSHKNVYRHHNFIVGAKQRKTTTNDVCLLRSLFNFLIAFFISTSFSELNFDFILEILEM